MKIPGALSRFIQQAYAYVKDPQRALRLLTTVVAYAKKNRSRVRGLGSDLKILMELIKAWATGTYKEIPTQTLVLIVAALLYFLWPLDFLPDPIFIDDAAVAAWVIQSIASDLRKYKLWKSRKAKKPVKKRVTRRPK